MRKLAFLLLLIITVACSHNSSEPETAREKLPPGAAYLIRLRNLNAFKTALNNNSALQDWLPATRSLDHALALSGFLYAEDQAYIALEDGNYVLLLEGNNDSLSKEQANYTSESLTYDAHQYSNVRLDTIQAYTYRDSLFSAYSNSLSYLRKLIETPETSEDPWQEILQASNEERLVSLLRKPTSEKFSLPPDLPFPGEQLVIDLEVEPEMIKVFGVGRKPDSIRSRQNPIPFLSPSMLPASTSWFQGYTQPEWLVKKQGASTVQDSLLGQVYELGLAGFEDGALLLLHTYALESGMEYLSHQSTPVESYQEHEIRELQNPGILNPAQEKFNRETNLPYFTSLDGVLLFSDKTEILKEVLNARVMEQTFDTSAAYQTLSNSLADAAHEIFIRRGNGNGGNEVIEALQLIEDQGSLHTAYLKGTANGNPKSAGTRKLMEIILETEAAIPPQFVQNHYTGKEEVVVQDKNQVLYRFGTSGQLLWKKPLSGLIQGGVEEVDLYHNRKWQLAFTAGNKFLVLDRNGKVVPPFDMELESTEHMNGLAVFDYDKDKDYRFLLTRDQSISMFNRKGQTVKGFTYTKADDVIQRAPKHIRMENRDYLVFQLADGQLKILNRIGRERVPVSEKFELASEVYAHKNNFVFTDKSGNLIRIDRRGRITKEKLQLDPDHAFAATPIRTIILNGNELQIGDASYTLDFGVYTEPQYFVIKNTVYIALTDLQSHRTYLFNSKAELLPGFPVYGNSMIDLADMDKDGTLELTVLGTDQNVVVYSLKY